MEIIPLIKIKKRKIFDSPYSSFEDALNIIEEEKLVYILDFDGIEKDKPNFCTYQRISSDYKLWVDYGPRNMGDVVDALITGADSLTLRKNLYPNIDISAIREISDNYIYINIDIKKQDSFNIENVFTESDGVVNFKSKDKIEYDIKFFDFLRQINSKNNLYVHELNNINKLFWKKFNVKGLLVDLHRLGEFNNGS
jgi:uncharacterized protein related to proFAR isomerase